VEGGCDAAPSTHFRRLPRTEKAETGMPDGAGIDIDPSNAEIARLLDQAVIGFQNWRVEADINPNPRMVHSLANIISIIDALTDINSKRMQYSYKALVSEMAGLVGQVARLNNSATIHKWLADEIGRHTMNRKAVGLLIVTVALLTSANIFAQDSKQNKYCIVYFQYADWLKIALPLPSYSQDKVPTSVEAFIDRGDGVFSQKTYPSLPSLIEDFVSEGYVLQQLDHGAPGSSGLSQILFEKAEIKKGAEGSALRP
jgi:hypothetical protein